MGQPWTQRKIGELFYKSTEKGKDGIPILSVSIHFGVSSSELDDEDLGKFVRRSEDKSLYLKVDPGDIVLNMMRAWQRGIGVSKSLGMVSPAYIVAKPSIPFDSQFLNEIIRSHSIIQKIDNLSYGVTDFRKRLYWESFSQINLQFPSLEEQKKIGNLIQEFDSLIDLENHKLVLLKEQKRGLLQKMFPKEGSDIPELRFPQFTAPWEQRKLGDLGEIVIKSVNPNEYPNRLFMEYSMPAFDDNREPLERLGNDFQMPRVVIMNSVLLINKLNVRKRRIWKVSKPSKSSICTGEFLPFYPNKKIELEFLNQQLISDQITNSLIQSSAGSSNSQKRITPQTLLDLDISVSSLEEQYKIGQFFLSLDKLITLHQRHLDLLKEQKKGLLQKMFPKEGEDAPEVRFLEFR